MKKDINLIGEKNIKEMAKQGFFRSAQILAEDYDIKIYLTDQKGGKVSILKFNTKKETRSFKSIDAACNKLRDFGFNKFTIYDKRIGS